GAGGHGEEVGDVRAHGGGDEVEHEQHRAGEDHHEQCEEPGEDQVDVGQQLDALAHAGGGGDEEHRAQDHDHAHDQGDAATVDRAGLVESGTDLHRTDPQGGGGAEDG